jgi:hypothetical protein
MSFDIPYQLRQLASSLPFPYYKRKTTLLQTFGIPAVHRIMNGKRPCKSNKPKERAEFFDDFGHCVIKRTIHGL